MKDKYVLINLIYKSKIISGTYEECSTKQDELMMAGALLTKIITEETYKILQS